MLIVKALLFQVDSLLKKPSKLGDILKLMTNIRLLLNTKKFSCHHSSLKLKLWWLTILLAAVCLTACMSREQMEPHKSSNFDLNEAEILSRPLDCSSLQESFVIDYEEGAGF
jgi:hypothetical protein